MPLLAVPEEPTGRANSSTMCRRSVLIETKWRTSGGGLGRSRKVLVRQGVQKGWRFLQGQWRAARRGGSTETVTDLVLQRYL
jgi:hypothetical protein